MGPWLLNRIPFKVRGHASSSRHKHAIMTSSKLMVSLRSRFVSVWLRRADLMNLFFGKTNVPIAFKKKEEMA